MINVLFFFYNYHVLTPFSLGNRPSHWQQRDSSAVKASEGNFQG